MQHAWRADHSKAVRFAREKDAKTIARALIDGESYRVVEHGWPASESYEAESQAPFDMR